MSTTIEILKKENHDLKMLLQKKEADIQNLRQKMEEEVNTCTRELFLVNQRLKDRFMESIHVMGHMVELSSEVIGSHSTRVANLSRAIAERSGCTVEEVEDIYLAAYLHDVGKVGLPLEILGKAEEDYTPNEVRTYKKHLHYGVDLMSMISGMDKVTSYIQTHHENYDGSGYPHQLKGQKIPLGGRIIRVADGYDKLLNLSKGSAMATPEKVLVQMHKKSNIYYDPVYILHLVTYLKESGQGKRDLYEIAIAVYLLQEGMVLSHDLTTQDGAILLTKNTKLSQENLNLIAKVRRKTRLSQEVYIYKNSANTVQFV